MLLSVPWFFQVFFSLLSSSLSFHLPLILFLFVNRLYSSCSPHHVLFSSLLVLLIIFFSHQLSPSHSSSSSSSHQQLCNLISETSLMLTNIISFLNSNCGGQVLSLAKNYRSSFSFFFFFFFFSSITIQFDL